MLFQNKFGTHTRHIKIYDTDLGSHFQQTLFSRQTKRKFFYLRSKISFLGKTAEVLRIELEKHPYSRYIPPYISLQTHTLSLSLSLTYSTLSFTKALSLSVVKWKGLRDLNVRKKVIWSPSSLSLSFFSTSLSLSVTFVLYSFYLLSLYLFSLSLAVSATLFWPIFCLFSTVSNFLFHFLMGRLFEIR